MKLSKKEMIAALSRAPLEKGERMYGRGELASRSGRHSAKSDAARMANAREDALLNAIDWHSHLKRVAPLLQRLESGQIDVSGLFHGVSSSVATELIRVALAGETEKNRLDAQKHLLALAGHNPSQKHEISRVDPNTPREALMAMIAGAGPDLKREGVDVEDDRDVVEDQSQATRIEE